MRRATARHPPTVRKYGAKTCATTKATSPSAAMRHDETKSATAFAHASTVMRAPGGNFKGDIVWTLQPYIDAEIGWNVDTEDWRRPGADTIASRIMKAKPGSVILMHDGGGDRSQTVEALKKALPQLKQEGYRFVTISELLQYDPPADSSVSK